MTKEGKEEIKKIFQMSINECMDWMIEDLEKLGYRKVRSVRVSFLDGAGVGYENEDGCFQLIGNKEMFIEG